MPAMPKQATDIRPGDRMVVTKIVQTINMQLDYVEIGWDDGSSTRLPHDAALWMESSTRSARSGPPDVEAESLDVEAESLDDMRKADLLEMAERVGADVKASMRKAEIIEAIEATR